MIEYQPSLLAIAEYNNKASDLEKRARELFPLPRISFLRYHPGMSLLPGTINYTMIVKMEIFRQIFGKTYTIADTELEHGKEGFDDAINWMMGRVIEGIVDFAMHYQPPNTEGVIRINGN